MTPTARRITTALLSLALILEPVQASLTTDIVWLEAKAVILPDGSTTQALVPTVYLRRPISGDITPAGALIAGGNITLQASGAGQDSNIVLQGSDVKAGQSATLNADGQVLLLAASNTASQTSSNSSSSAAVGVAITFGADGAAFGITASASAARGNADGADSIHTNSHIAAGNSVNVKSGGDATLQGAVISANTVNADVGGKLKIESLQDTSQYEGQQQNIGGSVTVGIGFSGSASAGQGQANSNFASVTQQSGIRAGDGGFQVKVKGNTELKGGTITSTQAAIDANKNSFNGNTTEGLSRLSTSDIQNHADFKASSMSLSTSGGGMGQQGGSAASTTTAAISGLAGNQAARTGDKETGIGQIFDADKVSADVNAQAAITQSFGQQASKAVGDYAGNKAKELRAQGNEEEAKKWDEGGTYRATAHAVIGGLTGGASGAAGAGAAAYSADAINQATADLPAGVKNAVGAVMAAGIGATAGGGNVAGVNAALNEDLNNRQLHPTEVQWIKDNGKKFAAQLSETLGHPVSEQEAMQFLTAAGESDVGLDAQRSNGQFVRGTSNTEVAQAYDAAKSFILSSTKTNNSFVDAQGQNQTLFTAKNGDFYKPEVYSQYRNDVQYRDYYWSVMGINLKGDNMSAQEKAVYDQRQIAVNQQTAKDLLTLGAQAVAGKVASGVAGRAGTPGTTTDTNKSGANGGVAVGEIGSGVRVYPDGSLRTPDGKFASVSGSPAPGTTAAANYADFLNKNGVNVVGQEMVVNGPLGPRRYDIVVQDATGNLQGIEIKSGGATKTTYQDFTDRFVNQFGAPGAGKLDGKSVTSTITIYVP